MCDNAQFKTIKGGIEFELIKLITIKNVKFLIKTQNLLE